MSSSFEAVRRLLEPRGIAVVGASREAGKVGYAVVKNLLEGGYRGGVYPVNPKADEILGLSCFKTLMDAPDDSDMAIVCVPAKLVSSVIEECGRKGVGAAVVISSGFGEAGASELEEGLKDAARRFNVRIVGPNTFGVYRPWMNMSATFCVPYDNRGGVALTCQSGGVGMGILGYARSRRVGLSALIGFGNKVDLDEADVMEFLAEDERTSVIALHMESVKDGRRFIQVLKHVSKVKPVVILKSGRTRLGGEAAKSHTGAVVSSDEVFDSAVRRAGGIRARSLEEFFDLSRALALLPRPKGEDVIIVTGAGGLGVLISDACEDYGVKIMDMPEDLREEFRRFVPPFGALGNPIDITGASPPEAYREAILTALRDERVHGLILGYWHTIITRPVDFAKVTIEAVEEMKGRGVVKPIVASLSGDVEVEEASRLIEEHGIIAYPYAPERSVLAIASLFKWLKHTKAQ